MYAVDFEYDGQYLSDYGFMICDFDGAGDKDVTSAGSNVTFTKVSRNYGKNYSLGGTSYDECVKTTFQICKKPDDCGKSPVDMVITNDEYRDLMRWLNRREFLKFQVFDEDDEERTTCYFDVSFNVSKIKIGGALYGLELALESNRPFGYGQELSATYTFLDVSKSYIFSDIQSAAGSLLITFFELVIGELALHTNIFPVMWDYSSTPLNFDGVICLPFSLIWMVLSSVAILLADAINYYVFEEYPVPYYKLFGKTIFEFRPKTCHL